MAFYKRRILSTMDSVNSGFCSRVFCLIGIMSTLKFVYLEALCLQVWPYDILLT